MKGPLSGQINAADLVGDLTRPDLPPPMQWSQRCLEALNRADDPSGNRELREKIIGNVDAANCGAFG